MIDSQRSAVDFPNQQRTQGQGFHKRQRRIVPSRAGAVKLTNWLQRAARPVLKRRPNARRRNAARASTNA